MNEIDLAIAILLILGAITGFRRGLVRAFAGFLSIGLAIWVGLNFSGLLEEFVAQYESIPPNSVRFLSLILTILLVYFGVKIVAKVIHSAVHTVGLGFMNRLGGTIFSLLLSTLALVAIYYYTSPYLHMVLNEEILKTSIAFPYLAEIAEILKLNVL